MFLQILHSRLRNQFGPPGNKLSVGLFEGRPGKVLALKMPSPKEVVKFGEERGRDLFPLAGRKGASGVKVSKDLSWKSDSLSYGGTPD